MVNFKRLFCAHRWYPVNPRDTEGAMDAIKKELKLFCTSDDGLGDVCKTPLVDGFTGHLPGGVGRRCCVHPFDQACVKCGKVKLELQEAILSHRQEQEGIRLAQRAVARAISGVAQDDEKKGDLSIVG